MTIRPLRANGGFALITALIFLIVLTLVAVISLRASGLELRMGTNNAQRTEAFESSDSVRLLVADVLDIHSFNRGWPVAIGGSIPNGEFDYDIPGALAIDPDNTGPPRNWYVVNSETTCTDPLCEPLDLDARYQRNLATTGQGALPVASDVRIFKVRTDINPGAGAAMVAGYEGTGRSLAGSGGRVLFFVDSEATDSSPTAASQEARSQTAAVFRHIIRN